MEIDEIIVASVIVIIAANTIITLIIIKHARRAYYREAVQHPLRINQWPSFRAYYHWILFAMAFNS